MVTIYRVYTEYKPNLLDLASKHVDGATQFVTSGLWKGTIEQSAVIEIVSDDSKAGDVFAYARAVRVTNKQECVLVTIQNVNNLSAHEVTA